MIIVGIAFGPIKFDVEHFANVFIDYIGLVYAENSERWILALLIRFKPLISMNKLKILSRFPSANSILVRFSI